MKKSVLILILILIPVSTLFAQLPESGSVRRDREKRRGNP